MTKTIKTFAALIIVTLVVSGCQKPSQTSDILLQPRPTLKHDLRGQSIEGRQIECMVFGSGDDVVLILATIHGDENAGTPLVYRLIKELRANPKYVKGKKVVIIPIANPDGLVANQRFNARGVDLNRNFDAPNRENNAINGPNGLSEPESVFIKEVISEHNPARIITLHESLACIDYDGPAKELAELMGKHCHLLVKKLGSRPGSLGSYAGLTLETPIITVELTPNDRWIDEDLLWTRYGQMLLASITYPVDPD